MKAKNILMAVMIFTMLFIYGVFSYISNINETVSMAQVVMRGFCMGVFSMMVYVVLLLFVGIISDKTDKHGRMCIIIENIILIIAQMHVMAMNTATSSHGFIVNLIFAVIVVLEANYDGRELRKIRKK